ncbi:SAM-dependent methyltransferase [Nakamurella sp. UYEF19]|uniref:class I SAM-dependent methyltransferase n=1 Tax=Nakamurella sp. UYEF19 TaxID=1756392 RepID=UPI00339671DC
MSKQSDLFEDFYLRAGSNLHEVPWANLVPNAAMVQLLDTLPASAGGRALVVGCGLGDDAEELARRGYAVTAFDVAPTAIDRCHQRYPDSDVEYVLADVLELPSRWAGRFDLVIEIRTLQCLPADERPIGATEIARTVAPGGRLYVRCYRLTDEIVDRFDGPPWPLDRADLQVFTTVGLITERLEENDVGLPGADRGPTFTAVYRRP